MYARLIPAPDQATVHRTLVLDLLQDHRRVQNTRSCSARGCAWHPSPVGRNGDPDAMRTRHHLFNQHLADLIVSALESASTPVPSPHGTLPAPDPTEVT